MSKRETEKQKLMNEFCQRRLTKLLQDEDNKYCVDCDAKGGSDGSQETFHCGVESCFMN